MFRITIIIILSFYILSIPIVQPDISFVGNERSDFKNNSASGLSSSLDLDSLVIDVIDLEIQIGWQQNLISYHNGSIYIITGTSYEETTLAKISLENGSLESYIVIPEEIRSIQFLGNSLYTTNDNNHLMTEYYEFPSTVNTRNYNLQSRILGPAIVTPSSIWYLSYEWVFSTSWGYKWELRSLDYNGNSVTSYPISYNVYNEYNCISFDGLRLSFLSDISLELFDTRNNNFKSSFLLPDINEDGTESTHQFSGLTFDGRYYWSLARNGNQLFKIDVLSLLDYEEDGVDDGSELDAGTSLNNADTDGDGMSDLFEMTYNLNPVDPIDNRSDLDKDGLTNIEEFNLNSNPSSNDTDGDFLEDYYEVQIGTDLNNKDSDGDGMIDSEDPRPLKKPQWWELIGPYWLFVVGLFFFLLYSSFIIHKKNS